MYETVKGLLLRETAYQESSTICSLLTENLGLLTVKARGVRRKNSPLKSACQLLCYGEYTLFERRGYYTVTEAEPIALFMGLRQNLERLSLGSYFAQVLEVTAAADCLSPELLPLGLNSLYALSSLDRNQTLVKAAFELRLLSIAGYTPMLDGCAFCGSADARWFHLQGGVFACENCRNVLPAGQVLPVTPGVLDAMRHIVACDGKKLFSFSLPEPQLAALGRVTEQFLLTQLERGFSALDFYKKLF